MLTGHASVALQRMKEQQQKHNQQHVAQMNSDAAVVMDGDDIKEVKEEIITSVVYVNKDVAQKENDDEDSGVPVIPTIDNDNYD
jgi:hypothetical protein